jgi:hypothetical protein
MAIGLRNAGAGIAVLHGWRVAPYRQGMPHERPPLEEFRRQQRDLYITVNEDQSGRSANVVRYWNVDRDGPR